MGGTLTLDFPFPLSTNNLFNNAPGLGRAMTREYKDWRALAAAELLRQRPRCVIGQVEVVITLQELSGRRDADNHIKAILDSLVENGIIAGDHNKIVRSVTARWGGNVVGAVVEIFSLAEREAA
jgi:crossover junction endodeoxyribonuclease RusA